MPFALPTPYLSNVVVPFAPNADGDRAHSWDWPNTDIAGKASALIRTVDTSLGMESFPLNYVGLTRSEARTLEQFFDARGGQRDGFWCPTFQHEFFASAHTEGDVTVREWGYAASIFPLSIPNAVDEPNFWASHFYAVLNGAWMIGQFSAISDLGNVDASGAHTAGYFYNAAVGRFAGTNVLTGFPTSAGGLRLGRCLWVRLADDTVTTTWDHPNLASISVRVQSIPHETPH